MRERQTCPERVENDGPVSSLGFVPVETRSRGDSKHEGFACVHGGFACRKCCARSDACKVPALVVGNYKYSYRSFSSDGAALLYQILLHIFFNYIGPQTAP